MQTRFKKILVLTLDASIVFFSVFIAYYLRIDSIYYPVNDELSLIFILTPFMAIFIFYLNGLYEIVNRHSNITTVVKIFKMVSIFVLIWALIVYLSGNAVVNVPRSVILIYWILLFLLLAALRVSIFFYFQNKIKDANKIIIYGAGSAGRQLISALNSEGTTKVVALIDDDKRLIGRSIFGIKIYSSSEVSLLCTKYNVKEVVLAIPSVGFTEKAKIISSLKHISNVSVRSLPSIDDLAKGVVSIKDIKNINIEDVLNRDKVKPDYYLLRKNIFNKVIMVTGAGGSIGTELCKQIVKLGAKKVILFEISEFALYKLEQDLQEIKSNCEIYPKLGSVLNQKHLDKIISFFKVETVFHAAAYKHVPLVESNPLEGLKNNALGTYYTVHSAIKNNVKNFVLISTDKAVRPTNVMGASKRIAEMIVQSITNDRIKFSIVRFGNVLGSSGSVIPLFSKQISSGGPVTVTHKNITRYFMTIAEAVELVIQAGSLEDSSLIYLLDMGKPIPIDQLARDMIILSGLKVKEGNYGDIEIKYTGLRPGEKMYEELLINNNVIKTKHPRIFAAREQFVNAKIIEEFIHVIEEKLDSSTPEEIKKQLIPIVEDYSPNLSKSRINS